MATSSSPSSSLGSVLDQVRQIILDACPEVDSNSLSFGTRFSDDLAIDQLDFIDLIFKAEEKFCVKIQDDILEKLETVGDLSEYVAFRLDPSSKMPSALTRKRRLSSPLSGVGGCGEMSVKTIGAVTCVAIIVAGFSPVGLAIWKQLALPLVVAIAATMLVILTPIFCELYKTKGRAVTINRGKDLDEKLRERRNVFLAVIFLLISLFVTFKIPCPTVTQQRVLQIVMALAAGAFAANLPGFISVKVGKAIKAGGALAAFVLVLLFNPASWGIPGGPSANTNCQETPAALHVSR